MVRYDNIPYHHIHLPMMSLLFHTEKLYFNFPPVGRRSSHIVVGDEKMHLDDLLIKTVIRTNLLSNTLLLIIPTPLL